jgi:(p)ppGpp synthase/HD superfamily hydrolase
MPNKNQRSKRFELLDRIPIGEIKHFGRPLKEHLMGTHDLLAQWRNAKHVCLAGLFHSVYGTKTFSTAALRTESRDDVRALIGERAEALAFIFGMSDRKYLLLENRFPPYCWIDHRSGEKTEISSDVLNELIEIEVANFVEQMAFQTEISDSGIQDMQHRFESARSRMSTGAREAFPRLFEELAGGAKVSARRGC